METKQSQPAIRWASILKQRCHSGKPSFHARLHAYLKTGRHLPSSSRQQKGRLNKWLTGQFTLTSDDHIQFTTSEAPPWLTDDNGQPQVIGPEVQGQPDV